MAVNLLKYEDSPYLQQHENNPVYWNPWGEEALDRARKERKPIFVSIGYSTCHWCHVMEREVFEKEEFASILNGDFISIKIDREERPDIDKYYQEIYQIMNKRAGGWPLSIFLTHEGKPFFSGTYIPPKPMRGMTGFGELLKLIIEKYRTNFQDIVATGESLAHYMNSKQQGSASLVNPTIEKKTIDYLKSGFDGVHGGFTQTPKFPHHDILLFILEISKDKELLKMGDYTLKKMAEGGLWDVVEGGFCRYSIDDMWLVPHYEKMLYDNALLTQIYAKAYFRYENDGFFRKIAVENGNFIIEKMMEKSLFYSASDADTQGEEGKYFVYGYDELGKAGISKEELKDLGVTKEGNFEGRNIIRTYNLKPETKEILTKIRDEREYPFIDRKTVIFQNAMTVKALLILSKIEKGFERFALETAERLEEVFVEDNGVKRSKIGENPPKIEGFLEDYGYLADAFLTAFNYTLEPKFLILSQKILNFAVEKFFDSGRWYFSKGDFPVLADPFDNSYPSAVGVIYRVISKLSLVEKDLEEVRERTLGTYADEITRVPHGSTTFISGYLKEYIKVSGKKEVLQEISSWLNPLDLESVIFFVTDDETVSVCDEKSCFFNSKDPQETIEKIESLNG